MPFPRNLTDDKLFFAHRNTRGKARQPLLTFTEMAEEFGLSWQKLAALMLHSKYAPPKARVIQRGHGNVNNSYYNPAEMREWWKRHTAGTNELGG